MKRVFTVTLELDTEAPVDPVFHRNRPGFDLGPDAIYVQLNGLLEASDNLRVTHVGEINLDLETPRMLVLSTAHIQESTAKALELYTRTTDRDSDTRQSLQLPIAYSKGEYGWLLPLVVGDIDEDKESWEAHPDLLAIRNVAIANGCTWIMLDQDADTIPDLPVYDW